MVIVINLLTITTYAGSGILCWTFFIPSICV